VHSSALNHLVDDVLAVARTGHDVFEGARVPGPFDRLYGGHVAAQALLAAAATVPPSRRVHALHVNFLTLGDAADRVTYQVERVRDSGHFSTRLVRAEQGRAIVATLSISFHDGAPSFDHDLAMSDVPPPETLPSRQELLLARFAGSPPLNAGVPWPIDVRYIDRTPWDDDARSDPCNRLWIRADGELPDDESLHACVLTYASDLLMFEPIMYPHGIRWDDLIEGRGVFGASLDHALWIHRPIRADDWLLHEHASPVAANSRAFTTGRFFSRDGRLVASVAQEIVLKAAPRPAGARVTHASEPG
jgi:acyl-CoA thioesterase-2